jgi:uncharacterized membrane protein
MIWGNPWSWIFVVVALALAGCEIFFRKRWSWAILCRSGWIICMGFCVADLSFMQSRELSQPSTLNLIVDVSDSVVRVPARFDRLKTILKEVRDWSSEQKIPVQLKTFSDRTQSPTFDDVSFGGYSSLLAPSLQSISEGSRVILVSDGLWFDAVRSSMPVTAVSLAGDEERDVWIDNAQQVYTAFLKNRLKIPLSIGQKGFEGRNVRISLKRGTQVVDSKDLKLKDEVSAVELSLFPEKMGEESYLISIEPQNEELSVLNNEFVVRVRTVRDKIRILHVGGKPSADLKAWRSFLTRQPDIDLVSFYILRSITDDPQARETDLSLIRFPYDELFSTELDKFDLVILQNFDFTLYFQPFYLSNLARFIENGGALFIIGGDQSFHRYNPSPLQSMFPFQFSGAGNFVERETEVSSVLNHPVVSGSEAALKSFKWTGLHQVLPRQGALDFARFKSGEPLLSAWDVGKGRVMALNSDESWKLQMRPQENVAAFSRLARRMLQYLTFDPEVNPSQIVSSRWKVSSDVSMSLTDKTSVLWSVEPVVSGPAAFKEGPAVEAIYPLSEPGWYRVNAGLKESRVFETEEKPWLSEWKRLISRDDKLKDIARRSEGAFVSFKDRAKIFEPALIGKQTIAADVLSWTKSSAYWSWIFLISSLFLLCLDFFIRKREQWDA